MNKLIITDKKPIHKKGLYYLLDYLKPNIAYSKPELKDIISSLRISDDIPPNIQKYMNLNLLLNVFSYGVKNGYFILESDLLATLIDQKSDIISLENTEEISVLYPLIRKEMNSLEQLKNDLLQLRNHSHQLSDLITEKVKKMNLKQQEIISLKKRLENAGNSILQFCHDIDNSLDK